MKKCRIFIVLVFAICLVLSGCSSVSPEAKTLSNKSGLSEDQAQNLMDACVEIGIEPTQISVDSFSGGKCEFQFFEDENGETYPGCTLYAYYDGDEIERVDAGGEVPYYTVDGTHEKAYDIFLTQFEFTLLQINIASDLGRYEEYAGIDLEDVEAEEWTSGKVDNSYIMISDFSYDGETHNLCFMYEWSGLTSDIPELKTFKYDYVSII